MGSYNGRSSVLARSARLNERKYRPNYFDGVSPLSLHSASL